MTLIPPPREASGAARLQMLGFSKRFGALQALDEVSLTVEAGSFHALLGENGAGKSTLVKALIGFYKADAGQVLVDGREVEIASPRDAARHGIGMIFQHFTVVPGMSVAENLALAGPELPARIDWRAERQRLEAFMQSAPFPLPLSARVADLAAGEKQKLEILKALYAKRRFLILDEPTSVLTPQEADEVLGRMKALCSAGQLSVLIITHKFREVFGCCDAVTVLRRGRWVGSTAVAETTRDALAAWMMGAPADGATSTPAILAATTTAAGAASAAPRLRLDRLSVRGADGRAMVQALSLAVQPGEIVGVAGISGNGQRELMAALTGALPIAAGALEVDGAAYLPTRRAMTARQVRSLPEEPLHNGCVGKLSIAENLALRNFDRAPLRRGLAGWRLSARVMREQAATAIERFKVKAPGPSAPIETLSGGNVQRAVLARELGAINDDVPRLLIVANPCFGLDFQASAEIHARLRAARDGGAGVLLISEDLDELLALASRIVVLSHGHIALECSAAEADIGAIGRAMAGDAVAPNSAQPAPGSPHASNAAGAARAQPNDSASPTREAA